MANLLRSLLLFKSSVNTIEVYSKTVLIYQPLSFTARSRAGVANLARQRVLTVASAGSVICSPVSETGSYISPAHSSHSMLGHSTPVNYTGPHIRAAPGTSTHQQIYEGSRSLNMQSQYHNTSFVCVCVCAFILFILSHLAFLNQFY